MTTATTRVRVRDFYYDSQDRIVMQGGEIGPDGGIIRGTEKPKRNGLQALYGGKPYSPGDEFDMNTRDLKAAGVGEPDAGIELASEHAARQERIARREQVAADRDGERGNWFERLANAQEEEVRAKALTMKLQSEKAREHIERALGRSGPEAGRHLAQALDAEGELTAQTARRAMELQQRLEEAEARSRAELAAMEERITKERADMAALMARQEKALAELQARIASPVAPAAAASGSKEPDAPSPAPPASAPAAPPPASSKRRG